MTKVIVLFLLFFLNYSLWAEENIIYKYKKYEKFDLGELEIKGNIIAPGDLSTSNLKVKKLGIHLYERHKFDDLLAKQIRSLR